MRNLLIDLSLVIEGHMAQILSGRADIELKPDGSPVTSSDRFLEGMIRQWLIDKLGPLKFVGEESFDFVAPDKQGYYVLLDPIDGTENFCSGLKEWGVSIGIWEDGHHLASMLLMPEMGERLVTGDSVTPVFSRITGLSSSFSEKILDEIRLAKEYRVTGCAVYNLLNVISGRFCRFVNPKGAYVWDLLPGLMLALEHNCEVFVDGKPFDGKLLDPTGKYCVDIRNGHHLHPW